MNTHNLSHYHCCASCRHFKIEKQATGNFITKCGRLGYETKPSYQFNCWDPKPRVKAAMAKRQANKFTDQ